ncbi:MAG: hypothetical protein LAN64_17415 [Acidobacteriia bacterium]|nr:hypothetical protein [Terriglobia bacterium]
MPQLATPPAYAVAVEVGGIPVLLRTSDADFARMLEERYCGFVNPAAGAGFEFDVDLASPSGMGPDDGVQVRCRNRRWSFQRGDFRAEWEPGCGRGHIRQSPNPYSVDSVLRIVHSIILAGEGGFLLHAASVVRDGRAFLFSGLSGAGKTTIARLALPDVTLLTDEVSYVRRRPQGYDAFGTPFAGELGRVGENVSAPISTVYLLAKGPENCIDPVPPSEAVHRLMRNILFFAEEPALVQRVFHACCEFVARVSVQRLTFFPDQRVWELIR